jgi:hypothetical protein
MRQNSCSASTSGEPNSIADPPPLDRDGSTIDSREHTARERFTGRSRRKQLDWFADTRNDTARLRAPSEFLLGAWDHRLPGSMEGVVGLEQHLSTVFPFVQVASRQVEHVGDHTATDETEASS